MTTTIAETKPQAASFEFCKNAGRRGTSFLYAELVAKALKIVLPKPRSVHFTEEEILASFARGEQLIWLPSNDAKNAPITMKRLYADFGNKAPLGGKLLCNTDCYSTEPFFTKDTTRANGDELGSWRLVGASAIPGTKGENYLRQTIIAAEYVRDIVYGGSPPEALRDILAEPAKRETKLAALVDKDWNKGGESLAGLPFNKLFRESVVEAMLRVIVNQKVNRICLLEKEYSWTISRSRSGGLVVFGAADEGGAGVDDWGPRGAGDGSGFFLSRSDTVEEGCEIVFFSASV